MKLQKAGVFMHLKAYFLFFIVTSCQKIVVCSKDMNI